MTITAEQRKQMILDLVQERGTVRVADLAALLALPQVTIRRDVAALADDGLLKRSHGVATAMGEGHTSAHAPVIGVLVPTVDGYFDEVIEGAREVVTKIGGRLVLSIAASERADDWALVARLLESGAQGLLLTPSSLPGAEDMAWIRDLPVSAVLTERPPAPDSILAGLDSVASDHDYGVLQALRHFASLKHESVMLAAMSDTWTAHTVRDAYATGMPMLGLTPQPVIDIGDDGRGMADVAAAIVDQVSNGVRAVLVHNDRAAIALAPVLRAHGLALPDDVALISYDDVFAELSAPPLTAVAPPKKAVGAAAMELILRRIRGGSDLPVHHLRLLPRLRVRTSCGAMRRD